MNKAVSILLLLGLSIGVSAEEGDIYIGGSFGIWGYEEKGNPDLSPKSIELASIYSLLPFLDIQGNFGFGIGDDSKIVNGVDKIELEIDNYLSVYAKPKYDVMNYTFYGLAGYSYTRLVGFFNGFPETDSSNGISFGAGVSVSLNKRSSFQVEWRQQAAPSAYKLSGFTVGYNYRIN